MIKLKLTVIISTKVGIKVKLGVKYKIPILKVNKNKPKYNMKQISKRMNLNNN